MVFPHGSGTARTRKPSALLKQSSAHSSAEGIAISPSKFGQMEKGNFSQQSVSKSWRSAINSWIVSPKSSSSSRWSEDHSMLRFMAAQNRYSSLRWKRKMNFCRTVALKALPIICSACIGSKVFILSQLHSEIFGI